MDKPVINETNVWERTYCLECLQSLLSFAMVAVWLSIKYINLGHIHTEICLSGIYKLPPIYTILDSCTWRLFKVFPSGLIVSVQRKKTKRLLSLISTWGKNSIHFLFTNSLLSHPRPPHSAFRTLDLQHLQSSLRSPHALLVPCPCWLWRRFAVGRRRRGRRAERGELRRRLRRPRPRRLWRPC
jgi:hypothetical protein